MKFAIFLFKVLFFVFLSNRILAADSYWLLVHFSPWRIANLDSKKLDIISELPYDGVAVQLANAYQVYPVKVTKEKINLIKSYKIAPKIWPWVFLNWMIFPGKKDPNAHFDFTGKKRQKSIFFTNLTEALKLAKEFNSPGIVLDLETYNNHKLYNLAYLSENSSLPVEQVKKQLLALGEEIGQYVVKFYPHAKIWLLCTNLGAKKERSISYIVLGMLNFALREKCHFKVIDGGEASIKYCHDSFKSFKRVILIRDKREEKYLTQYSHLLLAGVICPWENKADLKNWMLKNRFCKDAKMQTILDFKDFFMFLNRHYEYNWIYAAGAANYYPFESSSKRINSIINEFIEKNSLE